MLLPKLGASGFIALALAGQVVASLALDHFGMFGLVEQQMTVSRGVGALLLVAGVVLIQFSATPAKAVIAAS